MPVTNIPNKKYLEKLSIRAAVCLSLRATQRVAILLQTPQGSNQHSEDFSDERLLNISLLLVESFCKGTIRRGSSILANIANDAKWDTEKENSPDIEDPVLRSGSDIYSAAMQAQFGDLVDIDIPIFSTAQHIIDLLYKSLTAALEASAIIGDQNRLSFLEEVWRDYETLYASSTAMFPEYGPTIDATPIGPLGDLWNKNDPLATSIKPHASGKQNKFNQRTDAITEKDTDTPPSYLYKYVSFKTLLAILQNSTLRFSNVSDFNDPFDGQLLPIRKFGWKQFYEALRTETMRLATSMDDPIIQFPTDIPTDLAIAAAAKFLIEIIDDKDSRFIIFSEFFDESDKVDSLSKILRPMIFLAQHGKLESSKEKALTALNEVLDQFENYRIQFNLHDSDRRIISAIANMIQVLCLTEAPDSLLMWSHYAAQHKGAVLKFSTCSKSGDFFTNARQVNYEKILPSVDYPQDLARHYLGLDKKDSENSLSRQFFTKSIEWKYEKEWRVMASIEMKEKGEFVPFQQESLSAIFLGCRLEETEIQSVLDLVVDKHLPSDIYIAVKDEAEFALSFVPVSNGRVRSSASPKMGKDERGRRYRWCLDRFFEHWNGLSDDLYGKQRRLRSEGFLSDYGPPASLELFREAIKKIDETVAAKVKIQSDKIKEPKKHEKECLKVFNSSAKAYGALEDLLKEDLSARGGMLPERDETAKKVSDSDLSKRRFDVH
jgi:hypothetical protein